jgi:excinuclease ABC subunit B
VDTPFDSLFSAAAPGSGKGRGKSQMMLVAEPKDSQGYSSPRELARAIQRLEREMRGAARELEFERAAELRDRIQALRSRLMISESDESFIEVSHA